MGHRELALSTVERVLVGSFLLLVILSGAKDPFSTRHRVTFGVGNGSEMCRAHRQFPEALEGSAVVAALWYVCRQQR